MMSRLNTNITDKLLNDGQTKNLNNSQNVKWWVNSNN